MNKIISIAPGRTCLFGDHQDYLGLPIIACAISKHIKLTAIENGLRTFNINKPDINKKRIINIDEDIVDLEKGDHILYTLKVLKKYGCIPNRGYNIEITGNLPINAGTSSSSALVISWANFLIEAFGITKKVTPELISQIAYESEVLEQGAPGGMMDHYSIGVGKVVYINTSEPFSCNIIRTELNGLISGVSGVPKETVGLLAEVKGNTLKAVDIVTKTFKDFNLNKAEIEDLDKYSNCLPTEYVPYFNAAIKNHYYTKKALIEFNKETLNLKRIGELMNGHHTVLRDLLKITVPRIDDMIEAALKAGAYGAKIVGSGGGGSIVVIAEPGKEAPIVEAILKAGAIESYPVSVDSGARILERSKTINIEN
ncbi:galactokinase family protein [Flavivirga aquimarina]|uniref:Galactokinase family protein n=1 Tax=Flavivirga aquimarina TaxID=2027862 RepID=A0ABT8W777_9FLAO|nr:galactokinase family protein [Flavivirga aquimarina]MDO5968974.1 galactokinase family protein [Flavivirga aquimarina]